MSNSRFILQGITQNDDHIKAVSHVFSLHPFGRGLVATAFMNAAGASMLVTMLGENSKACRVFVGIRNGVTTIQALQLLLENGIHPIVVDTASQAYIFHPKVYLASNNSIARLIIGSANITLGGLAKNVEASIFSEYQMDENAALIESIYDKFEALSANYPENVFRINTPEAFERIRQESLLVDETRSTWHSNTKSIEGVRAESRQRMRLNTRCVSGTMSARHSGSFTESVENSSVDIRIVENQNLLWKSKALTRRDLNIPEGERTNRTGSMLLKKGDPTQLIDQRSYFRLIVFGSADWKADPRERYSHLERCICKFRFIIKGIDYGVFSLRVTHNTRTDTASYRQNNSMTQIHWGPALSLVATEDLLGAFCYLYAQDDAGIYTLVFDEE